MFRSRDAAAVLATLLADHRDSDALVLGIPAVGVPVATRLATDLGLSLNVLVVSKITLPWNPEAGYGAIAADGTRKINDSLANKVELKKIR